MTGKTASMNLASTQHLLVCFLGEEHNNNNKLHKKKTLNFSIRGSAAKINSISCFMIICDENMLPKMIKSNDYTNITNIIHLYTYTLISLNHIKTLE